MIRNPNGRGLFYTRDSGGKHEMTPGQYVGWAANECFKRGLTFRGTGLQIDRMIREGKSADDDLFLDFDVKGNVLSRVGLDALKSLALGDPEVHTF
jgi:hypothetical protein